LVVKRFWKGEDAFERVLRDGRPEARDGLVADLARTASAGHPARRWSRVAFASALTVFMVGFFASFGGLAYAAASAHSAASSVTRVVKPSKTEKLVVRHTQSAGQDQYGQQQFTPPAAKPTKVIKVAGVASETPTQSSGELPFTGLGLGVTALLGLTLLALGALLRRRESRAS
jgi:hypothetical protein